MNNLLKISMEKLLERTDDDITDVTQSITDAYSLTGSLDSSNIKDVILVNLAHAFTVLSDWQKYYHHFNEIVVNISSDDGKLKDENAKLQKCIDEQNILIGQLQAKLNMYNELLNQKNNSSNLVSIDLVDMIEKLETIADSYESAIKAAEHKAAMKTFNKRVASGDVKPAKRADISDEYIIENVNNGVSAYKIAHSVGMTQQAILYRIKKLREDGLIE